MNRPNIVSPINTIPIVYNLVGILEYRIYTFIYVKIYKR